MKFVARYLLKSILAFFYIKFADKMLDYFIYRKINKFWIVKFLPLTECLDCEKKGSIDRALCGLALSYNKFAVNLVDVSLQAEKYLDATWIDPGKHDRLNFHLLWVTDDNFVRKRWW